MDNKNKKVSTAKQLMGDGWKAREDYRFKEAEDMLNEAYELFVQEEDYFNATECLNHLSINERLKAGVSMKKAIECAQKSYKLAQDKGTKTDLILRALMSSYGTAGEYELGMKYVEELLSRTEKPANRADYLTHLAMFKLRAGDISSARDSIEEAEKLLDEGWDSEREPHRSIWKCAILMNKSVILYNLGKKNDACKYAKEALELAKAQNLKARIQQAERLMELFA